MQNTYTLTRLVLHDGTELKVRPVRPGDAGALQRLVGRLSERTTYLRYFGPMKELGEKKARHFAEVDGYDRFALVALDPDNEGEIVAVVRFDREREKCEDQAEYAALVEDKFQGQGLGIGMTWMVIDAAKERGIKRLFALVLSENRRMLGLLRALELPEKLYWEDGATRIEIDLEKSGEVRGTE
ncbi:GNAT family N-acetyltransferase [Rubrobacter indicoceani]|uniref:GNAT family N-acetyltransferase n=1 Tax=Rubrobacter indicoceani TaxID=2051957 RepID=UPI000E5A47A7|nr:GNAT family N-acetyltransferase [Rubrobacter indicoceani]